MGLTDHDSLQVIVLAGGKGKRMQNEDTPKVLIPFKGRPLLSYALNAVLGLNLDVKPIAVVGYLREQIIEVFANRFQYAVQEQQLGTAHAVLTAKGLVSADRVLVMYGDMPFITTESLKKLIISHALSGSGISMLTAVVDNFEGRYISLYHYGRIIRASYEEVSEIKEFRDCSDAERQIKEVNPGIYLVETELLWEYLEKVDKNNDQNEYYLTDIVKIAIEDGQEVNTVLFPPEEAVGINSMEDLKEAEKIV